MSDHVDLLVRGAELVVTMNAERREIAGGWIACRDGFVTAVGAADEPPPRTERVLRADGCLVTPGLINTHHDIYQNLTRAYRPAAAASLFDWLTTLYPLWARLDEESSYLSAPADLVAWKADGLAFAGAVSDPVEAWLRCGPVAAHHTVVAGRALVEDGELRAPGIEDILRRHRAAAVRMQEGA